MEDGVEMGVDPNWLDKHHLNPNPKRQTWMADYFYAMLKDGVLVMLPAKDIHNLKAEVEQLKELGYKLPRFSEQFEPVDGIVVRRELHDKKTKTGKAMYRFFVKEGDGTGAEHMVIAFDPTEFKRGDRVTVSMGAYGKQAKYITNGEDWDDDNTESSAPVNMDDIPF